MNANVKIFSPLIEGLAMILIRLWGKLEERVLQLYAWKAPTHIPDNTFAQLES